MRRCFRPTFSRWNTPTFWRLLDIRTEAAEPGGGGIGASAPPLLYLGKKCPFSGMKVPYFHRIEVPFLQNLSALFGQCPSLSRCFRGLCICTTLNKPDPSCNSHISINLYIVDFGFAHISADIFWASAFVAKCDFLRLCNCVPIDTATILKKLLS